MSKRYAIYATNKTADIREIKISSILDCLFKPVQMNTKSWFLNTGNSFKDFQKDIIFSPTNQPKFLNKYDNMDFITMWSSEESAKMFLDKLKYELVNNDVELNKKSFLTEDKQKELSIFKGYKFAVVDVTDLWEEFTKERNSHFQRKLARDKENIIRIHKNGSAYDRLYTKQIEIMIKPSHNYFNPKNNMFPLGVNSNTDLRARVYVEPSVIYLEDFSSFDELLSFRDKIRDLELVPIKSDDMHKKYHSIDKSELLVSVEFNNSNIILTENKFPYMLPEDVSQNLIWIKDGTSQEEVIDFVEEQVRNHGMSNVIIFERPNNIDVKLVKGSFPFIRHIHFWHKK
jgi:hypothetical protein